MGSHGFFLDDCFMKLRVFSLHLFFLAFFLVSSSGVIFAEENKAIPVFPIEEQLESLKDKYNDTDFKVVDPSRITIRNKTQDGRTLIIPEGTQFLQDVCSEDGECWQVGVDGGGDIDQMLQNYCFLDQGLASNFEPLVAVSRIFSLNENASFKKMNAAIGDVDQYDINTYVCEYMRSTKSRSKGIALWNEYKNKYESTVELSARAYSLPPQLLSCLILKESVWDPGAKSHTGARCLGQFTESAREHVDGIASFSTVNIPQHIAELDELRQRDEGELILRKDDRIQHQKDVLYRSTLVRNASYKEIWQAVFAQMRSDKKVNIIPTAFRSAVRIPKRYPHHCIVATALYLRYIIDEILASGQIKEDGVEGKKGLELIKQVHEEDKAGYEAVLENSKKNIKALEAKIESGSDEVSSEVKDSFQIYKEYEVRLKNIADDLRKLKDERDVKLRLYNEAAKKFKDSNWKDSKARESMKNISEELDGMEKWICEGVEETLWVVENSYLDKLVFSENLQRNIKPLQEHRNLILAKKGIKQTSEVIAQIDSIYNSLNKGKEGISFLTFVAGLYNYGSGGFRIILGKGGLAAEGDMFKAWNDILKHSISWRDLAKYRELSQHLRVVRQCLTKSDEVVSENGRSVSQAIKTFCRKERENRQSAK